MSEEQNDSGFIDGLIEKFGLPKWVKSVVVALGIGGGSGLGGGSVVYMAEDWLAERLADPMAIILQEDYGIVPVPEGAIPLLENADSLLYEMEFKAYQAEKHVDTLRLTIAYQLGANHVLIQMSCDTIHEDGITFYEDCYKQRWVEQKFNGMPFIYRASKQYGKWVYFPFQWQIEPGQPNIKEVQL